MEKFNLLPTIVNSLLFTYTESQRSSLIQPKLHKFETEIIRTQPTGNHLSPLLQRVSAAQTGSDLLRRAGNLSYTAVI